MEEERAVTPEPANVEAVSRPGSSSSLISAAIAQLPGIPTMPARSATSSPQPKTASTPVPTTTPTTMTTTTTIPPPMPPVPPTEQIPAEEAPGHEDVLPATSTIAAADTTPPSPPQPPPTLTPTSTSAPMQFPTYTQNVDTTTSAVMVPASAEVPAPAPAPAPAPLQLPTPAPVPMMTHVPEPAPAPAQPLMQVPIVAPMPVTMNNHIASSPAAHAPTPSGNLPTCHNCSTSTTPLWRRDEMGSVLCNACGLFLKLHGRPRPISLKTDVIKSRNRVKTMRPDMQKKKQSLPAAVSAHGNFQSHDAANAAATAAALAAVRATQQKGANGHGSTDSSVSRTTTPNVYDPGLTFHTMDHFHHEALQYPMSDTSPGRPHSPTNGEQQSLDAPQTHEQLIAANSSLKTRVSELDLINELYRGRLQQLEQDNQTADNYRHAAEMSAKEAATERAHREEMQRQREEIQRQLEDSHRRENNLKRRLDDLEQEMQDIKSKMQDIESDEPAHKRLKMEEQPIDEAEQLAAALQVDP